MLFRSFIDSRTYFGFLYILGWVDSAVLLISNGKHSAIGFYKYALFQWLLACTLHLAKGEFCTASWTLPFPLPVKYAMGVNTALMMWAMFFQLSLTMIKGLFAVRKFSRQEDPIKEYVNMQRRPTPTP